MLPVESWLAPRARKGKRVSRKKKSTTSLPETEGWGSYDVVSLIGPAVRRRIYRYLALQADKTYLASRLGLPRSTLYSYIKDAGSCPKDEATRRALKLALELSPLETRSLLRDAAALLSKLSSETPLESH